MKILVSFVLGLLFATGLGISGMSSPYKVRAFLDVGGQWDPSLALVMVGAIGVFALFYVIARRRERPLLAERFHLPEQRSIDVRLLAGSALFGLGWGLSGYCPGPAIMAMSSGRLPVLLFGATLLASAWLTRLALRQRANKPAHSRS